MIFFKCDICEKCFKSKFKKESHIESIHNNIKFECDLCNELLSNQILLSTIKKEFMKTLHGQKTHFCVHCNNSYTENNSLKRHIKTAHGKENKKHKCDE